MKNLLIMIFYIYLLILILPYSNSWFFEKTESSDHSKPNSYNQLNPVCWFTNCLEKNQKNEKKTKFTVNPRCWFTECDEKNNNFNPYCWFANCGKNEDENLWITDEQIIRWGKEKVQNIGCWFKECSVKENKPDLTVYDKIKGFFNDFKSPKGLINNFLESEWHSYCWYVGECCTVNYIPSNITGLRDIMNQDLYGQHLTETVIDAISAHWNLNIKPTKALALSFHGSVGVGKNYLSSLIAKNLFKLGMKSKFVHYFTGRVDFTLDKNEDIYRQNLYTWLRSNVTQCPKQLFIFDNIEHMPPGILDDMKPFLDYRDLVDGVDYRQCIFIFISNTGSNQIEAEYQKVVEAGKSREEIVLRDFEKIVAEEIFTHEGPFHNSDAIKYNLIDHYIPFLPLEEEHVTNCIKSAFMLRNIKDPQSDHINDILENLTWTVTNKTRLSVTGCKSIAPKVSLLAKKFYEMMNDKSEL